MLLQFAHIRRAYAKNMDELFFRRPFNYQDVATEANSKPGELESGLLWTAYAKDLSKQLLAIKMSLSHSAKSGMPTHLLMTVQMDSSACAQQQFQISILKLAADANFACA